MTNETNCALCDRRIRERPDGTWRAVPAGPMTREDPVRAAAARAVAAYAELHHDFDWDKADKAMEALRAALAASPADGAEALRAVVNEARLISQWADSPFEEAVLRAELRELGREARAALGPNPCAYCGAAAADCLTVPADAAACCPDCLVNDGHASPADGAGVDSLLDEFAGLSHVRIQGMDMVARDVVLALVAAIRAALEGASDGKK